MFNNKRDLTEIISVGVDRINVAQDSDKCQAPVNKILNLIVPKMLEIS